MTDPNPAPPSRGAPHRPRLHAVDNLGAGQELDGLVVTPRSLFAPRLHCPCCLIEERNDDGDGLDLRHVPDCALAAELVDERAADLAILTEQAEHGWPQGFRRLTTEAEADVHETWGVDARGEWVIVLPDEGGSRGRWWYGLAAEVPEVQ